MSRGAQIGLSLAVSAVAVYYSVRGIEFDDLLAHLADGNWWWVCAIAASAVVSLWLRAVRWKILLEGAGPIGDAPVLQATYIGFMGNMLLPLRAGEAIKPALVVRGSEMGLATALATVALERICDLAMLALFAIGALLMAPGAETIQNHTPMILTVVGVATVGGVLVVLNTERVEALVVTVAGWLPERIGHFAAEGGRGLLRSLAALSAPMVFGQVFGLTFAIWLATVLGFSACALTLQIDVPLLTLGVVATVAIAVAVAAPSAPGYVGIFWVAAVEALKVFGLPKALGLTFGLLSWVVQMIVIVALGGWALSKLDLSLSDMQRETQAA